MDKYEVIRKKLLVEYTVFKQLHFECKTRKENNIGLTEILNGDDIDDINNISLNDNDINDIISSGQFATV